MIKKDFIEEHVMTKKDNENIESFSKCWSCDKKFFEGDVKVRDHCHVTGRYRDVAERDCNIDVSLN